MEKRRETELDILRLVALVAVILVHSLGLKVRTLSVTDRNWQILSFVGAVVTWQVPAYVMISGRFFLDPERAMPPKKILKAIWRLVIAFAVWDIPYQAFYVLSGGYDGLNWKGVLSQALIGPYHFWYLHMLIWLYAIVPFLRRIAESKRLMEYFLILFLLFQFLTNYGAALPFVGATLAEIIDLIKFHFALGYSGYFILGYYLYRYRIPDKFEIPLYIIGALLIIFTGVATTVQAVKMGGGINYSKYLMPNVVIESAAVYTFFVKRVGRITFSDRTVRWISKLSEYSFGVYLIHAFVEELVGLAGISPVEPSPFIMLPVYTIIVCIVSNIMIALLRKVPYIGKKIT